MNTITVTVLPIEKSDGHLVSVALKDGRKTIYWATQERRFNTLQEANDEMSKIMNPDGEILPEYLPEFFNAEGQCKEGDSAQVSAGQ